MAGAQGLPPVNASPNTVGSGARALGMGNAFIAVADDATAASWNPGGLTQLQRPEISFVYNWNRVSEDYTSSFTDEFDGANEISFDDINYASFAYPLPFTIGGRNLVVSLNYQRKYDFDRALDFTRRDATALEGIPGILPVFNLTRSTDIHYRQEGGLATLSPAFAFEITDRLSVGMTVNIWDQSLLSSNEWKIRNEFRRRTNLFVSGPSGGSSTPSFSWGAFDEDYTDFEGTNYTFGLLYRPTERLSLGAVYHTGFAADVTYQQVFRSRGGTPFMTFDEERRRMEFPTAIGLGAAYRFRNDKLTLSLDVTRTSWDSFVEVARPQPVSLISGMLTGTTHFEGFARERTSPITGLEKGVGEVDPTYTVRFGGEYVFFDEDKPLKKVLPSIRAGVFYDPEPSGGRPNSIWSLDRKPEGDGEPEDAYGITLGAGALFNNWLNLDFAYEYRWGDDIRTDTLARWKNSADVEKHRVFLSTVIYF